MGDLLRSERWLQTNESAQIPPITEFARQLLTLHEMIGKLPSAQDREVAVRLLEELLQDAKAQVAALTDRETQLQQPTCRSEGEA